VRRVTDLVVTALCIVFMSLAAPVTTASAASLGQPVGRIYLSDIVAYMDGMPTDSYNIGGCTVVVCEDLADYGFLVSWSPEARVLVVKTQEKPESAPTWPGTRGEPGAVAGTIYATDIMTYVNSHVVTSYNIGGRTAVAIEDLGSMNAYGQPQDERVFSDYGFSYAWDAEKRTISVFSLRPGSEIACDLGICTVADLISTGQLGCSLQQRPLRLDGVALNSGVITATLPIGSCPWPRPWRLLARGGGGAVKKVSFP
jgi:hypothetical protein